MMTPAAVVATVKNRAKIVIMRKMIVVKEMMMRTWVRLFIKTARKEAIMKHFKKRLVRTQLQVLEVQTNPNEKFVSLA